MTIRSQVGEESVQELYRTAYVPMLRLAVLLTGDRSVAEDCVQEAFVGLWRRADRLRDPEATRAYLRTAVVNGTHSLFRRRATARRHLRALVAEPEQAADHAVLVTERDTALHLAVTKLPRRQREVVVLRYWSDLSFAEIAATLGMSESTARSTASRAVAGLQATWER